MNETHDHLEVPQEMFCQWCLIESYGFSGINGWRDLFSLQVESNWERGDKRKYWSLLLFGFHFQGGWLWTRNDPTAAVDPHDSSEEEQE